jgi:hypothetical protein
MIPSEPRENLYTLTTYSVRRVPSLGDDLYKNISSVHESFDEAYRSLQMEKEKSLNNLKSNLDATRRFQGLKWDEDHEFVWAYRIECFDLRGTKRPVAGWSFDYGGRLYSKKSPPPIPVPRSTDTVCSWEENTVVAVEYKGRFHFGLIERFNDGLYEVDLTVCDLDGIFHRIWCDPCEFLPYSHDCLYPYYKTRLLTLLAIVDLGESLLGRSKLFLTDKRRTTLANVQLVPLCPMEPELFTYYELSKITCEEPRSNKTPTIRRRIGYYQTPEDALKRIEQEVARGRYAPLVLKYEISMQTVREKCDLDGQIEWVGSWEFDGEGHYLGWNEWSDRPFHGRRPEDRAFEVGDLVTVVCPQYGLMAGLVVSVPRTPDNVREGMDMSDDGYFVSGIIHNEDGWIDGDHFHETQIFPLMNHLNSTQVINLTTQLLTEEEYSKYESMIRLAPSVSPPQPFEAMLPGDPRCLSPGEEEHDFTQTFLAGRADAVDFRVCAEALQSSRKGFPLKDFLSDNLGVLEIFERFPSVAEQVRQRLQSKVTKRKQLTSKDFKDELRSFLDELIVLRSRI